jgi:hypothetical protein
MDPEVEKEHRFSGDVPLGDSSLWTLSIVCGTLFICVIPTHDLSRQR